MQLIYAGKTQRWHPKGSYFQMDLTWQTQKTIGVTKGLAIQHLHNIIFPYFKVTREELGLPENQKCLLIYMMFSKHEQETSIVSILTGTVLCMYKYHQILPIFSNLSTSVLMHSQNHFWNRGSGNGTQKR